MLKASRKSRRVLMAGAVGIAGLTIAGLGLTASGAAAEKIRTVAETQVEAMTSGSAAATGTRTDVVGSDGAVTEHSIREDDRDGKRVRTVRLVIREKDGSTRTYVDGEADAYLKAHPEMAPPAGPTPPAPPGPGGWAPPAPPAPPSGLVEGTSVTTTSDGRTIMRTVTRNGPGSHGYAMASLPEVVSGDCRGGTDSELVRSDVRDGKTRTIICEKRIERFASAQARAAEGQARALERQARATEFEARRADARTRRSADRQSRAAELQARRADAQARAAAAQGDAARRSGLRAGLAGIAAGRAAVMNTPGMSAADRKEALADLDEARAEIEAEMRAGKDD